MDQLMHAILLWLSVTFALPETAELPHVRHLPPEQIAAIRYGGPHVGGEEVVAVYHDRLQTVFLPHGWDRRDPADVSILVHELVHHLQNVGAAEHLCAAEREALAYEAQQRWLELHGQDLESAFGIDAMTLKLRTTCLH